MLTLNLLTDDIRNIDHKNLYFHHRGPQVLTDNIIIWYVCLFGCKPTQQVIPYFLMCKFVEFHIKTCNTTYKLREEFIYYRPPFDGLVHERRIMAFKRIFYIALKHPNLARNALKKICLLATHLSWWVSG